MGPSLFACESGQRLISPRTVAVAATGDQIVFVIAATVTLAPKVVEGDVSRVGVVQVSQAVDAGESITEVDRQSLVGSDPLSGCLVFAAGFFRLRIGHISCPPV